MNKDEIIREFDFVDRSMSHHTRVDLVTNFFERGSDPRLGGIGEMIMFTTEEFGAGGKVWEILFKLIRASESDLDVWKLEYIGCRDYAFSSLIELSPDLITVATQQLTEKLCTGRKGFSVENRLRIPAKSTYARDLHASYHAALSQLTD